MPGWLPLHEADGPGFLIGAPEAARFFNLSPFYQAVGLETPCYAIGHRGYVLSIS